MTIVDCQASDALASKAHLLGGRGLLSKSVWLVLVSKNRGAWEKNMKKTMKSDGNKLLSDVVY